MRIFYDTEFIDDGSTIDPISIGVVADDGREYYAVSSEFSVRKLAASDWLMKHVWPSLPQIRGDARMMALAAMREGASNRRVVHRLFDRGAPEVKPRRTIALEVRRFIADTPDPRLWAWYGAYDHVVLAQLWGPMSRLPAGVPMWTNDLRQEHVRLGEPQLPEQGAGQHNALADARHNRVVAHFLDGLASSRERAAREERDRLLGLLPDLLDPDPCSFDHHGGCQAHSYLSLMPGQKCPQQEAKELLAELGDPTAQGA